MKLVVQIPCLNEEKTLPVTVNDIPKSIEGIDEIEILVMDDGSSDRTSEVAEALGVNRIIRSSGNVGLARTFTAGLDAAIKMGADIIVNTDADNQYKGEDIPKLIAPILEGGADIVVGDRQVSDIEHFSFLKKRLQWLGSWVVRQFSGTDITDTTSGFRAYSRESALKINIVSPFTYTLETIIQAGKKHMKIVHVPIRTNKPTRKSRLFKSIPSYIQRSVVTIVRMYTMFQPMRVFFYFGVTFLFAGSIGVFRFLYFYMIDSGASGHVQSLVLSGVFLILGFMLLMIGLVADIISFNRRLIEDVLYRVRKMELVFLSETGKTSAGTEKRKESDLRTFYPESKHFKN